jgi:tRNA (guanine37-N1)-methyltransferase
MLKISVISLFAEMFDALAYGIVGRALKQKQLQLTILNPRDFTNDTYHRVDDRSYGGGPGMVMLYEPLAKAIQAAKTAIGENSLVIHMSPQGKTLNQAELNNLNLKISRNQTPLIILCSRYEGVDQRLIDQYVDCEYSIGDFVVSGGELPALLFIDGLTRLQDGVVQDPSSIQQDSFQDHLLDYPHYTRPEHIDGQSVPKVLLSGDHQAISRWRLKESLGRTWQKRPDLLKRRTLTHAEQQLLHEFQVEHSSPDCEDTQ